jgi:hypothetical protein
MIMQMPWPPIIALVGEDAPAPHMEERGRLKRDLMPNEEI